MTATVAAISQNSQLRLERESCGWCGLASGRPGVTLRKHMIPQGNFYLSLKLCPLCEREYKTFGKLISYREWFRLYRRSWKDSVRKAIHELWLLLSPAMVGRVLWFQYRLRVRRQKVRTSP